MAKEHGQQGVASISEYVVTFFLVIAVVVAMTTYVRRSLQARMRDARHYMVKTVGSQCIGDENCMRATGLSGSEIREEYEPYYVQANSDVTTDALTHTGLLPSANSVGIFISRSNIDNQSNASANQLPPVNAVNDEITKE